MIGPWLTWLKHDGKNAVKHLYNPLVIAAARQWRGRLEATVCIGVTGSAGKTSTKDLLHAALTAHAPSSKSDDSNNQLYNVARTVLASRWRTRYLVQELGISVPGAFEPMLSLLRPKVGVVTNLASDHLGSFGSQDAIAAEKGKLVRCLPSDGLAVLNADDPRVRAMAADCRARVVTYGFGGEADFRGRLVSSGWPERLSVECALAGGQLTISTRFVGNQFAGNVLAALATAVSLGVPAELAARALGQLEPAHQRMSVQVTTRGITIIRDDHKAPAWSLPSTLQFLQTARPNGRRFLVVGTVSDHDGKPDRFYRRLVDQALLATDYLVLVGHRHRPLDRRVADSGGRVQCVLNAQAAAAWLRTELRAGDLMLLKGSNRADHLARLAINLDQDVHCWRSRCARQIPCDRCGAIGVPHAPDQA
jgi:UDP-N-acetylmuramoyl-tripeptide--D-alanyl-D-alanine ligase